MTANDKRYGQKFTADLEKVTASLWCDQLTQENMVYQYDGPEKKYDALRLFEKVQMYARFEKKMDSTDVRVAMHFDGVPRLPACNVMVHLETTDSLNLQNDLDLTEWNARDAKPVPFSEAKGDFTKIVITLEGHGEALQRERPLQPGLDMGCRRPGETAADSGAEAGERLAHVRRERYPVVDSVVKDSIAEKQGVQANDLWISYGGQSLEDADKIDVPLGLINQRHSDEVVEVVFVRDGKAYSKFVSGGQKLGVALCLVPEKN